jgi:hypothetical protein
MRANRISGRLIEPLGKQHDQAVFDCVTPELNPLDSKQAGQDLKKKVAATFVLVGNSKSVIAGYYTLSSPQLQGPKKCSFRRAQNHNKQHTRPRTLPKRDLSL